MKLEHLAAGSPDCPLLRLYDFTAAEAANLLTHVNSISAGSRDTVALHELPWVQSIRGCQLNFRVGAWDEAVVRGASRDIFDCVLTEATWENIAGLIEPFAQGASGYQWLAGPPGEVNLLFSLHGDW